MDNQGNDRAGDGKDQGKGSSSSPAENKELSSAKPEPLRDGHDVGKPPGTSYPVQGK